MHSKTSFIDKAEYVPFIRALINNKNICLSPSTAQELADIVEDYDEVRFKEIEQDSDRIASRIGVKK